MSNIVNAELPEKNESWNFIYRGKFDIDEIKKIVLSYDKEWDKFPYRQRTFEAHKETKSIVVEKFPSTWLKFQNEPDPILKEKFSLIIEDIVNSLNAKLIGAVLVWLPAGKEVLAHIDKSENLVNSRRHHIAISTNENVWFKIGDENKNLKEGELWEVNNANLHSVLNNGDTDRIHVIIDLEI